MLLEIEIGNSLFNNKVQIVALSVTEVNTQSILEPPPKAFNNGMVAGITGP